MIKHYCDICNIELQFVNRRSYPYIELELCDPCTDRLRRGFDTLLEYLKETSSG